MATNNKAKKPCCKCEKKGSTFTCNGCEQAFCLKHTADHREELLQQIDVLGQQHDLLKRDAIEDTRIKTILVQIDRWEQELIEKIQLSADKARTDLQRFTKKSRTSLNVSIDQLSNELRLNQIADDYTEEDLNRWTKELQNLRKELEEPLKMTLVEDKSSEFYLIRLQNGNECTANPSGGACPFLAEKFSLVAGAAILSEDHRYATCTTTNELQTGATVYASICGQRYYSRDIFNQRFRLHINFKSAVFLGIMPSSVSMVNTSWTLPGVHGFWTDGNVVCEGRNASTYEKISTQLDDEVTLVLDCPSNRIIYIHERTQKRSEIQVKSVKCPFPWKIVLTLWYPNDRVELLGD